MRHETRFTHLDLFSGIGGFSLAFEAEGFKTIGFAEIDPYAIAVLRKHWPGVTNFGDVRNVPAMRCDIITGGFPCQPFSSAGQRKGAADDRHLWPAMLDVINRCRPTWALCENVAGIVSLELDNCIASLEDIGYAVQPIIIPACAVDARHRRDRVWILAHCDTSVGSSQSVGDSRRERGESAQGGDMEGKIFSKAKWEKGANPAGRSSGDDADSKSAGLERSDATRSSRSDGQPRKFCEAVSNSDIECGDGRGKSGKKRRFESSNRREDASDAHVNNGQMASAAALWPAEPAVGRVADGIPNRPHRLKCLGNSIVYQVAQEIARCIRQCLTTKD